MATQTKAKKVYIDEETIVCIRTQKKDGTPSKVFRGYTNSGKMLTLVPVAGDVFKVVVTKVETLKA